MKLIIRQVHNPNKIPIPVDFSSLSNYKRCTLMNMGISFRIAKRREIQFGADADWPHTDPANAGIRMEFQLPPDRVMK
jgi:hypothetical protein